MANKYYIKGIRRFNAEKVQKTAKELFLSKEEDNQLMTRSNKNENGEVDSFTVLTDEFSTQGVNLTFRIDGQIILELPWLASIMDVRFCFAYLKAVKKVHRTARIVDENGKDVKTTDEDAKQQWFARCDNMAEVIEKGEDQTVKGWHRDFHIHPKRYDKEECIEDKVYAAFDEFAQVQWMSLGYDDLPEELRHVTEEEELSCVRVIDNTKSCFIGSCTYIGLMKANTCKMVKLQDFYSIMENNDFFHQLDYEQAILDPMPEEMWSQLYDKAEGIVIDNYRKTFIMRWNTDISNHKMTDFEDSMENFYEEGFYYDWSIWDFQKAHIGDKFYMIRTGNGVNGVVMKGTLIGTPYVDEDWSGRGRKVYYIRMSLSHLIHPDRSALVLTTEELSKAIPDFNWQEGHSGELLTDEQAIQLDLLWEEYLQRMHELRDNEKSGADFTNFFKEKGWVKNPYYDNQGEHIATIMEPDDFLEKELPNVGKWPLYGSAHTSVNQNEYVNENANVIAVRTGDDMGMLALVLNNEKQKRLDFICAYPMHRGMKHHLHIKKVVEWESMVEALVFARTEVMDIAFFATDYYAHKDKYVPGSEMEIDLAACAYVVEEGDSEIVLDEETSSRMRKDMGIEEEMDENGHPLPLILHNDELVAYLPNSEKYPDNAEFASPVKSIEEVSLFGMDFIKAIISISHEPEETYIPLYFKKEWLPDVKEGTLLRGVLWMQGQISD